jgi:DNA-binding response OmpR family regulator
MAERILVAEDQLHVRRLIEMKLKTLGYKVTTVENGQEALDIATKILPDLILLDVMMPLMTGFEVLSRLKQHAKAKKIPVILVTAQSKEEEILHGLELGAEDYISKPFSPNELAARVKKVLASHTHKES